MEIKKSEEIKDIALKLNEIHKQSPYDYYFLKGYISCLTCKENSKKDLEKQKIFRKVQ